MAGVFPAKRSTSGRKQWTLHDGQRSSLKRLRNQLASDGCPESQVVLAKQLLDEDSGVEDRDENARLGVYWLMKASDQGNIEATDLLKECFETGKGITEHNYLDVKSCISMTQDEKLARRAAREMFANMSNGGEYITSVQLQKRMLSIDRGENKDKYELVNGGCGEPSNSEIMDNFEDDEDSEEDWSQRSETNEKVTEDHLVTAAVHYSHGQLPRLNRLLCLTEPNLHALDHISFIHRSILHPLLALKILYYRLIRLIGNYTFSKLTIFTAEFQFLLIFLFYTAISLENILSLLPMIVFYITIGVMVFTTFQMLQTKREFFDFRIWSGLFIAYSGGSLNPQQAEYQFIRNNLKPYFIYFMALLVNLLVYPAISKLYIPQSELSIFSFCLTFMTLFGFMFKRRSKTIIDFSILFSFAVNVLAKYPYETDPVVTQGWRFLDLKVPNFTSYIIGNGIEFCLNFRTLLYAFIPVILLRIGSRENWRGLYKYVIPHCVTLSWLQIVIISSQGATMYGLIRGTLALVGFVLFLPLVGLTTIFLPAAALAKWLVFNDYIYTISIFVLVSMIGISICYLLANSRFKTYTSVLQMLLAIGAIYFLLRNVAQESDFNKELIVTKPKSITYEQYQKFCHEHSWNDHNVAQTQILCSKLQNIPMSWEGYINDVRINSVENNYKAIFDKLPKMISSQLYCFYGEKIHIKCSGDDADDCLIFQDILKSNQKCSMDAYDVYSFEIPIRMQSGMWGRSAEILLRLGDEFRNFTLGLRANDHIWFKGNLLEGLGSARAVIQVVEVGCLACHNSSLTSTRMREVDTYKRIVDLFKSGTRLILNFVFYPVVVFK